MTTVISPSNGQGIMYLQTGPGASPGYGAIDRRRDMKATGAREGILSEGSYPMTLTAALTPGPFAVADLPEQLTEVLAAHRVALRDIACRGRRARADRRPRAD